MKYLFIILLVLSVIMSYLCFADDPYSNALEFAYNFETSDEPLLTWLPIRDSINMVIRPQTALKITKAFYEDLCSRNENYRNFNYNTDMIVKYNENELCWYVWNKKPQNGKYYFLIIDKNSAEIKALWIETV